MLVTTGTDPLTSARPSTDGALDELATCPSCHHADAMMTTAAISAGADWRCTRCGQRWDRVRLATVAAYARWLSTRPASPTP
jgi:hypothetical protein